MHFNEDKICELKITISLSLEENRVSMATPARRRSRRSRMNEINVCRLRVRYRSWYVRCFRKVSISQQPCSVQHSWSISTGDFWETLCLLPGLVHLSNWLNLRIFNYSALTRKNLELCLGINYKTTGQLVATWNLWSFWICRRSASSWELRKCIYLLLSLHTCNRSSYGCP